MNFNCFAPCKNPTIEFEFTNDLKALGMKHVAYESFPLPSWPNNSYYININSYDPKNPGSASATISINP